MSSPTTDRKARATHTAKPKDVKIDWYKYDERRRAEGINCSRWTARIADRARELMGIGEGARDRRISAILVWC